jgi:enoyl-CoA hydratase/carnithine racemase
MKLEKNNSVSILRLNNGKANALSADVFDEVGSLITNFLDSDSKALVLTGSTGFFSGGLELPAIVDYSREELKEFMNKFESMLLKIFTSNKPIICAVNGHAIAGGLVIALQCDYRIASTGKYKLGLLETKLGIGLPLLPLESLRAQVPVKSWMRIAFEAELFNPETALELGIVDEVVSAEELEIAAINKAMKLGEIPQSAFDQVKQGFRISHMENIENNKEKVLEQWLDTWFSDEGRSRVTAQVASLTKK